MNKTDLLEHNITFDERLVWSKYNSIYNIIIGENINIVDARKIVFQHFNNNPYFVFHPKCLDYLAELFDVYSGKSQEIINKELGNVHLVQGMNFININTFVENIDINIYLI